MTDKLYVGDPPAACNLCCAPITDEFSDAAVRSIGQWADVCPGCAAAHRVRYGEGAGQRWRKRADGKFIKVEG
jgi:hypothetical protein